MDILKFKYNGQKHISKKNPFLYVHQSRRTATQAQCSHMTKEQTFHSDVEARGTVAEVSKKDEVEKRGRKEDGLRLNLPSDDVIHLT